MTSTEVEALVRNVIVHHGLPFAIVGVVSAPHGWTVKVRAGGGGTVSFTVHDGRPVAMRMTIQEKLEAEL
jgi:hypothetical protein